MPIRTPLFIYAVFAALTAALPVRAADAFVQFVAGIELIRAARDMSEQQKAACYRKLIEVTGMSAAAVEARINSYRDRPEQWYNVHKKIAALLEEPESEKE